MSWHLQTDKRRMMKSEWRVQGGVFITFLWGGHTQLWLSLTLNTLCVSMYTQVPPPGVVSAGAKELFSYYGGSEERFFFHLDSMKAGRRWCVSLLRGLCLLLMSSGQDGCSLMIKFRHFIKCWRSKSEEAQASELF